MVYESKHPLIKLKLSLLRDENTNDKLFRELLEEITMLLTYEAFSDISLITSEEAKTPTGSTVPIYKLEKEVVALPILRAGLGMVRGLTNLIPTIKVGHIGLYRDEKTLKPVRYYYKMPQNRLDGKIIILDPMIATGNSICDAISALKKDGYNDIIVIALIAAPSGLENIKNEHPDINIYLANIDEKLNEHGYVIPGLGDAGDRIFGTK
ncbi:MAG: uracil phosphoribosyltransferase [Bacilli bacterium]|jgi:uracil phosphoribosyltransferase